MNTSQVAGIAAGAVALSLATLLVSCGLEGYDDRTDAYEAAAKNANATPTAAPTETATPTATGTATPTPTPKAEKGKKGTARSQQAPGVVRTGNYRTVERSIVRKRVRTRGGRTLSIKRTRRTSREQTKPEPATAQAVEGSAGTTATPTATPSTLAAALLDDPAEPTDLVPLIALVAGIAVLAALLAGRSASDEGGDQAPDEHGMIGSFELATAANEAAAKAKAAAASMDRVTQRARKLLKAQEAGSYALATATATRAAASAVGQLAPKAVEVALEAARSAETRGAAAMAAVEAAATTTTGDAGDAAREAAVGEARAAADAAGDAAGKASAAVKAPSTPLPPAETEPTGAPA